MNKILIISLSGLLFVSCKTWVHPDSGRVYEIDLAECRAEATEGRFWFGRGGQRMIDELTRGCLYKRGWKRESKFQDE